LDIFTFPITVDESLVEAKANSSLDSSQINDCVCPEPLFINKPESKVGTPV
jgi:hypothetical protein